MNLQSAIIQFLANEFHFEADQVTPDTNFQTDLGLTPTQVTDLLQRLQESLDFILPEDKTDSITTVGALLQLTETDND